MDPQASHQEDHELVQAVLAEDPRAIDALVRRLGCIPRILKLLNQRTGTTFRAEDMRDLTQDMLALVWPRMQSYTGQASLESWVYGFCFNGFMNALRKRRWRNADSLEADSLESPPRASGPLEYDHLHRGLDRLDDREVRVIRLRYFDELTFDEIGVRLGMPPNTAKSLHYRGMRRLQILLSSQDLEEER